ncbi:MAG: hypothetical protein II868_00240, partial [Butyrivibrio sp.]|nr:hypothetical protein [Butyrivibrio sp.]
LKWCSSGVVEHVLRCKTVDFSRLLGFPSYPAVADKEDAVHKVYLPTVCWHSVYHRFMIK